MSRRSTVLLLALTTAGVGVTRATAAPDSGWLQDALVGVRGDRLAWQASLGDLAATSPGAGLELTLTVDGASLWSLDGEDEILIRVDRWGDEAGASDVLTSAFTLGGCASSGLFDARGACLPRAEADHDGLIEWWENGEDGLEHGFDLAFLPTGERLWIDLAIEGATAVGGGKAVTLVREDGTQVQYEQLIATDSTGRVLPSVLLPTPTGARIVVDAAGAVAPISVDPVVSTALQTFTGAASYDVLGVTLDIADFNRDGYGDVVIGAPSSSSGTNVGKVYVYKGAAAGPSATATTTLSSGVSGDDFGRSLSAGDLDADGYADLVVGAPLADATSATSKSVYVFKGSSSGLGSTARGKIHSSTASYGKVVRVVGDLYGDGFADFAVGTPSASSNAGSVDVFNVTSSTVPTTASSTIAGSGTFEVGAALAGGDINGDGYSDLAVGAPGARTSAGQVSIYFGSSSALSAATTLTGSGAGTVFGAALSIGETNGDAYQDLLVGGPNYSATVSEAGGAWLYRGTSTGISSTAARSWLGATGDGHQGFAVAIDGDNEGDGYADVVVAAPGVGGDVGEVYIDEGTGAGPDGRIDTTISAPSGAELFGAAVSLHGDVNGDGRDDLLIGAPYTSTSTGKAWVYAGYLDEDGDGYAAEVDCDDSDRTVYPGAVEQCDGVDEDCDGTVDDNPSDGTTYFQDSDGDSYGNPSVSTIACSTPTGYVRNARDCDDAHNAAYPGATEICDGLDNDCDGDVDVSASDAVVYYRDADGDGYGDIGNKSRGCSAPDGYVENYDDCDDAVATTFPGAPEYCNEADDDCDGTTDESAVDAIPFYWDVDGDGYGGDEVATTACRAVAGSVANTDDCNDTRDEVYPGAPETCNDRDDDCDGALDEDPVDPTTWYRDSDGDGYGDVRVGTAACDVPSGYVGDDTDCNDASSSVHPGASEYCNDEDEDCDGTADDSAVDVTTWYWDVDGDGWGGTEIARTSCDQPPGGVATSSDCNDVDWDIFPGAPETCDGVDQDCSGVVDDHATDAPTWYADADGDGYGDASSTYADAACSLPDGYSADATDCDDGSAQAHPDGTELCNDADDDCDGIVDEDGADAPTWYADADHDGAGDPAVTTTGCFQPTGYVAAGDDCDDARGDVLPGAPETCDGADQDCDGIVDEEPTDGPTFYTDDDGDGFGDAGAPVIACAEGEGIVADATDCDDEAAGTYPGAVETCDETDEDCDGTVDNDAADARDWYADSDDDGFGDPTVTEPACTQPDGYVGDNTDCDDGDAAITSCPDTQDSGVLDDTGTAGGDKSGCGCSTEGPSTAAGGWLAGLLALVGARRRRQ